MMKMRFGKTFTGLLLLLVFLCWVGDVNSSAETDKVKANVLQTYVDTFSTSIASQAITYMSSLNSDGSWADVDYTVGCSASRSNWKAATHTARVRIMTVAWYTPASKVHNNASLLAGIKKAFDYWLTNDYTDEDCTSNGNTASCPCGTAGFWNSNWWYNVINTPTDVAAMCMMLPANGATLSSLEQNGCKRIMARAAPASNTGANLLWVALVGVQDGLYLSNDTMVTEWFSRANQEVYIAPGSTDGIKVDGSFFQHNQQIMNGAYGQVFFSSYLTFQKYAKDTIYLPTSSQIDAFSTFALDGTRWMTYMVPDPLNRAWDLNVIGRSISLPNGYRYTNNIPSMVTATETYPRAAEFAEWAATYDSPNASTLVGNRFFWKSDFMIHRRSNYFTSVRMISTRMRASECVNTQNLKGNYLADGANFLMKTGREYFNIFPAWDWYKIPGITVDYGGRPFSCSSRNLGTTEFVGGVSDGTYGAASFDYINVYGKELHFRKSWFFFDNEYVVLVSDITCTNSTPVYSVIDQRYLNTAVYSSVKGASTPETNGTTQSYTDLWWLHHDSVGYLFPDNNNQHGQNSNPPAKVSFSMEQRSGDWSAITSSSTGVVNANVFALWLTRQTTTPVVGDSLSYIVVPDVELSTFASSQALKTLQDIVIISNTPELHAVYHESLNILYATFFVSGNVNFRSGWNIQVSSPCIVMVRESIVGSDTLLNIAVSDPTQKLASVIFTIDRPSLFCSNTVSCNGDSSSTSISFTLAQGEMVGTSSQGVASTSSSVVSSSSGASRTASASFLFSSLL